MKVRSSVKPICEKCKVIKRKGSIRIICEETGLIVLVFLRFHYVRLQWNTRMSCSHCYHMKQQG